MKSSRFIAIFTLLFITSLTGCSLPYNKAYVGPIDGQRARLRLSTDGIIRLMPNSACVDWDNPGAGTGPVTDSTIPLPVDKSNNGKRLGIAGTPPTDLTNSELFVRAGEPILIFYQKHTKTEITGYNNMTLSYCNGVFVFTPEIGKDYVGIFRGVGGGDRCVRSVTALAEAPQPIENAFVATSCPTK